MGYCQKWGPFNLLVLAMFLMLADLTRHLVNDAWGTSCTEIADGQKLQVCSSDGHCTDLDSKYTQYCKSVPMANEYTSTGALSVYGWAFTIVCTWSGFACLFAGICWAINLPAKVSAEWRRLRPDRRSVGAQGGPEPLIGGQA